MSIKGLDFDPYTVLNVARDATKDQLIRAFREQALKWHPDKNPDNIDTAKQMFIKISESFKLLSDAAARAAYDQCLKAREAREQFSQRRRAAQTGKRKQLLEELERRELEATNQKQSDEKAEEDLRRQIERIRRENSQLLKDLQENIEKEIHRSTRASTERQATASSPSTTAIPQSSSKRRSDNNAMSLDEFEEYQEQFLANIKRRCAGAGDGDV